MIEKLVGSFVKLADFLVKLAHEAGVYFREAGENSPEIWGLEHFEHSFVEQSDTLQEFEDNPVELVGICVKLYKTTDLEKLVGFS